MSQLAEAVVAIKHGYEVEELTMYDDAMIGNAETLSDHHDQIIDALAAAEVMQALIADLRKENAAEAVRIEHAVQEAREKILALSPAATTEGLSLQETFRMPIKPSPRVVIFSGAGLSADSGIPTYRGSGGLYDGLKPEQMMSAKTFASDPQRVHKFCDDRRVALGDASPNAAHRMIARLGQRYPERCFHFTQNIDDLVERAGYNGTVHLHGELTVLRSLGNPLREVDIGYRRYWEGSLDVCPAAGFQFRCPETKTLFRPHVVLFGEIAPGYRLLRRMLSSLTRADLLVVIGTQGGVVRIDDLTLMSGAKRVLNNLHDSDHIKHEDFDLYLKAKAVDAAQQIEDIVVDHLGDP
jgi:NAD-dependent deacetylase